MSSELASRVKRDSAPVRRSFVERESGSTEPTPLAMLLRTQDSLGGRGGALRVALMLSLIWICARPPYSTTRVAAYWAELLGRDDPRGEGARAVRDCLHELQDRDFLMLVPSGPQVVILLKDESLTRTEDGEHRVYQPPYDLEPYISIPRSFWTSGLAGRLSGAGIAMYLVALAMTRHDDPEFWLSGSFFDDRFGISRSTRKRGLAELAELGVLTSRSLGTVDVTTFRVVRRNIYTVAAEFLQPAAKPNPASAKADQSAAEPKSPERAPMRRRASKRAEDGGYDQG